MRAQRDRSKRHNAGAIDEYAIAPDNLHTERGRVHSDLTGIPRADPGPTDHWAPASEAWPCVSSTARSRPVHSFDRDGRCYFCPQRELSAC